jgi:DNA-binding transcriptional MerR regulator
VPNTGLAWVQGREDLIVSSRGASFAFAQTLKEGSIVEAATLLTLPQLANAVGVEYRTMHAWLRRGLVQPSMQRSRGTGTPNLFSRADAVKAKVIADLRHAGLSFDRLAETAAHLDANGAALTAGALVLVNGSVSIADAQQASAAIKQESLTLVYNTQHAIKAIDQALALPGPIAQD